MYIVIIEGEFSVSFFLAFWLADGDGDADANANANAILIIS